MCLGRFKEFLLHLFKFTGVITLVLAVLSIAKDLHLLRACLQSFNHLLEVRLLLLDLLCKGLQAIILSLRKA
jgi:hypothetical protein